MRVGRPRSCRVPPAPPCEPETNKIVNMNLNQSKVHYLGSSSLRRNCKTLQMWKTQANWIMNKWTWNNSLQLTFVLNILKFNKQKALRKIPSRIPIGPKKWTNLLHFPKKTLFFFLATCTLYSVYFNNNIYSLWIRIRTEWNADPCNISNTHPDAKLLEYLRADHDGLVAEQVVAGVGHVGKQLRGHRLQLVRVLDTQGNHLFTVGLGWIFGIRQDIAGLSGKACRIIRLDIRYPAKNTRSAQTLLVRFSIPRLSWWSWWSF